MQRPISPLVLLASSTVDAAFAASSSPTVEDVSVAATSGIVPADPDFLLAWKLARRQTRETAPASPPASRAPEFIGAPRGFIALSAVRSVPGGTRAAAVTCANELDVRVGGGPQHEHGEQLWRRRDGISQHCIGKFWDIPVCVYIRTRRVRTF